MDKQSVLVGMSGGLDSAIAAYRLIKRGFNVTGTFIRSWKWENNDSSLKKEELWLNKLSKELGMNIEVVEREVQFKEIVINKYIKLIEEGFTPNPCIFCNPFFKFETLIQRADKKKINHIATGHYAIIMKKNDEWKLLKGKDQSKEQSYVLCLLNQEILSRTLLPLGMTFKHENKKLAEEIGLDYSNFRESQDLCFVDHNSQKLFLKRFVRGKVVPGEIHDITGRRLGHHDGLALYTIGQRKGIQISSEEPYYVVSKDYERNILIIGHKEDLGSSQIIVQSMNWISGKSIDSLKCEAKIRYHSKSHDALVERIEEDAYRVKFNQKISDLTPGQFAVLYNHREMLGGGMIMKVLD